MCEVIFSVFATITGQADGASYLISRWIFIRFLGAIYLIAFASLWVQITGLIGEHGILPVQPFLQSVKERYGWKSLWRAPTLFWLNSSNATLHGICFAGVVCAALVIVGIGTVPALVFLWFGYLSLTVVGRNFLAFQWDVLLLETGFLAVFFATDPVSPVMLFLLWWLIFRLMFESGVVKLTSGDRTWRDLTALDYHFFTQPLPNWVAWYFHNTPAWFRKTGLILTYTAEILLPVLIWGTSGSRAMACTGFLLFQALIMLTGNYNFFNLLTLALSLLLLDDAFWNQLLPTAFVSLFHPVSEPISAQPGFLHFEMALAFFLIPIGTVQLGRSIFPNLKAPALLTQAERMIRPFFLINPYGLFRHMTTRRPEILIEGSRDGRIWKTYAFKYKPGDVFKKPGFVEPHQPRLDWQMWFAALSNYHSTVWFQHFLFRLLEGRADVLRLLDYNPFESHPPQQVRAVLYEYCFTRPEERRKTGAWWKRREIGPYSPILFGSRNY